MRTRTTILTLLIVVGMLGYAGLRPFEFARKNDASWVATGPGMLFQGQGLAVSQTAVQWGSHSPPTGMTVEMWLRSAPAEDSEPRPWFVLIDESQWTHLGFRQEGRDLVVWDAVTNPGGDRWFNDFRIPNAIRPGRLQHFAVTSEEGMPRLYIDGAPADTSEGFPIPLIREGEPFGGTLVVGAGPPWENPWAGEIEGLALYDAALPAEEIEHHAGLIPGADPTDLAVRPDIIALYVFDEQGGTRVDDRIGANPLFLPEYYLPPYGQVLAPVDLKNWATAWNAMDVVLNFAGFIPLGLLLTSLLRPYLPTFALIIVVTAIGAGISLTIELAQAMMISRNSSLQDLILNAIGTLTGAIAILPAGRKPHTSAKAE